MAEEQNPDKPKEPKITASTGGDLQPKIEHTDNASSAAADKKVELAPGETKTVQLEGKEDQEKAKPSGKHEGSDVVQNISSPSRQLASSEKSDADSRRKETDQATESEPRSANAGGAETEPEKQSDQSAPAEKSGEEKPEPASAEQPDTSKDTADKGSDLMQEPQPLGGAAPNAEQDGNSREEKPSEDAEGAPESEKEKQDGQKDGEQKPEDAKEEGKENDGKKENASPGADAKEGTKKTADGAEKPSGTSPQQNVGKPGAGTEAGKKAGAVAEKEGSAAAGAAGKGAAGSANEGKALAEAVEIGSKEIEKRGGKTAGKIAVVVIFVALIILGIFTGGVFLIAAFFYGLKHKAQLGKLFIALIIFSLIPTLLIISFQIAFAVAAIDTTLCSGKAKWIRTGISVGAGAIAGSIVAPISGGIAGTTVGTIVTTKVDSHMGSIDKEVCAPIGEIKKSIGIKSFD